MTTAVLLGLVAAATGSGLAVAAPAIADPAARPAVADPAARLAVADPTARPAVADPAAPTGTDPSARRTAATTTHPDADRLRPVGDLVVSRLALAEPVAESKWLSGKPIADPAREQAVVDAGVARARAEGVDPDLVERVLRDQIAASKLVQRGLFTRWIHEPESAPTTAPDLTAVRTQITQIDDDLVDRLAAAAAVAAEPRCAHAVVAERQRVEPALDPLQRKGLHVAWSSFCRD